MWYTHICVWVCVCGIGVYFWSILSCGSVCMEVWLKCVFDEWLDGFLRWVDADLFTKAEIHTFSKDRLLDRLSGTVHKHNIRSVIYNPNSTSGIRTCHNCCASGKALNKLIKLNLNLTMTYSSHFTCNLSRLAFRRIKRHSNNYT